MLNPSMQDIERIEQQWRGLGDYEAWRKANDDLEAFFKNRPQNTDLQQITEKVRYLDVCYNAGASRNVQPLTRVAEKIAAVQDFDERVRRGDITLVDELADAFERRIISFASKYCALHSEFIYHNEDSFVICDSIVVRLLKGCKMRDKFTKKGISTANYAKFKQVLEEFRRFYGLECSLRKIDWYLWKVGKLG